MTPLREEELRSFSSSELEEMSELAEALDAAQDDADRQKAITDNVSAAAKLLVKIIGF
jgi:hypothetical protein